MSLWTPIIDVDTFRPPVGVETRNIQIFQRFHALTAGRLNAENCAFILSRALKVAEGTLKLDYLQCLKN